MLEEMERTFRKEGTTEWNTDGGNECAMRKGRLGSQTDQRRGKEWKLASWLLNLFFVFFKIYLLIFI